MCKYLTSPFFQPSPSSSASSLLSLSCCRLIFLTSCFIHIVFLFLLSPSLPHSCCGHLKMYVLMLCVSTEHRKHAVGGQLIKFQHTFTQKILFGSHNAVDAAADDDNKWLFLSGDLTIKFFFSCNFIQTTTKPFSKKLKCN